MSPLLDFPSLRTLSVGPLTFHLWGLFVALGIIAAVLVAVLRARRFALSASDIWDLAFWSSLAGLVGARVLYVIEYWRDFADSPMRVIAVWEGGMSAFGAVLLGVPVAWWWARRHQLSFARLAEAVAPSLLLGDAIGRLGGALSHMYPGKPTTFPIAYVLDGVQRHEVGIELALASFLGFLVILWLEKHWSLVIGYWSFPAPLVLGWYSLERFLLDFLRAADLPVSDLRYAPHPWWPSGYSGLTLAQYLAVFSIIVGLVFFLRARTRPVLRS